MSSPFIVVGVDGSDESRCALQWAVGEAQLRHESVHVVHAWWAIPELEPGTPIHYDAGWDDVRNIEAPRCLEEFVDHALGGDRPKVEITVETVQGMEAAPALLAASQGADLLVVGSHGSGDMRGLLLGSVSRQCALHATCPVVVVPGNHPTPTH
jgi:nucleotide-binding universal stress UspA family protein